MTRLLPVVVLGLVGLLLVTGCKKKQAQDIDELSPLEPIAAQEPLDFTVPQTTYGPQPLPVAPEPASASTYVVQRGDTLWSIARRSYGDGASWKDIAAANGISDPKKLRVGQSLVLP